MSINCSCAYSYLYDCLSSRSSCLHECCCIRIAVLLYTTFALCAICWWCLVCQVCALYVSSYVWVYPLLVACSKLLILSDVCYFYYAAATTGLSMNVRPLCWAIQFLLTFSWKWPMRKLQFAHGCTLRIAMSDDQWPIFQVLLWSILLRCIATTPPAHKEWGRADTCWWEALLNKASCFDCLFDCSVDVCGLKHICHAFAKVGVDDIIRGGIPARGSWCGGLAL
jgi:hypothetical protein